MGLAALLITARMLTPATAGFGTHQQLGLPPCTFMEFTNRPCPSCGMTTSWSLLVRFRVLSALEANIGGTLLGLLAFAITPWLLMSSLRGRWQFVVPDDTLITVVSLSIVGVTLLNWGWTLWAG